jgi:hypothetical protein
MDAYMTQLREDHGVVAVVVAILMIVFLGLAALAVDMGYLYTVKRQLQASADAAALAGVRELLEGADEAGILAVAEEYADYNAENPADGLVMLGDDPLTEVGSNFVRVTVEKESPLFFGRMWATDPTIQATAEARVAYITGMTGLVPIWVSASTDYQVLDEDGNPVQYTLTNSNQAGDKGNWGALDFPPKGGGNATFEQHMLNGYDGIVKVGDPLDTETGQGFLNAKKTKDAISSREGTVIYVPVVTGEVVGSSLKVTVVSFAAFYLVDFDEDAKPNVIIGNFLEYVEPTTFYQENPPDGSSVYGQTYRLVTPQTEL